MPPVILISRCIYNPNNKTCTVYSRYIAVVYIMKLDISRSHVWPHFLAHSFHEFCSMMPMSMIFLWNCSNSLKSTCGTQFFVKSTHHSSLRSCSRETIFHEITSSLAINAGWNTCCVMVSHMRQSIDTSMLIQRQCKSGIQTADHGINNAFLIKSLLFDHAVYTSHLVWTQTVPQQIKCA